MKARSRKEIARAKIFREPRWHSVLTGMFRV